MAFSDIGHNVAQASHEAGSGVMGEFSKLGKIALSQLFGSSSNVVDLKHGEIKDLAKKDDKASEIEHAEVRAKVKNIYDQYYAQKKKKEEITKQQQEEQQQEEVKRQEEFLEGKKKEVPVNPSIDKARAEIKNYGAE